MANRDQIKYAMGRLNEIAQVKTHEIRLSCTTPAVPLTAERFLDLAKAGKIKINPDYERDEDETCLANHYGRISSIFLVSSFYKKEKFNSAEYKRRCESLTTEVTQIKDQLMLGDMRIALDLIDRLQKAKF